METIENDFIMRIRINLTKEVFPAKIKRIMKMIMGYADWKGNIDWSTREVPVFVYAERI